MTAYVSMARAFLANWLGDRELGQGMVEYTLIVGTISLVIVAAFLTTNIGTSISELASEISCSISGGTWTAGTPGTCGA
jgi:Flp pilus assembly pilin Flp